MVGINLRAFEAAQGHDEDAAHLHRLKGFHFFYVMFKDIPI